MLTKEEKRFDELRTALDKVESAILEAMPLLYTEEMTERMVKRKDFQQAVLDDLVFCVGEASK